jgi:diadenosine tetraphosphate (Ap4A) HIT family hydrolase
MEIETNGKLKLGKRRVKMLNAIANIMEDFFDNDMYRVYMNCNKDNEKEVYSINFVFNKNGETE